MMKIYFTAVILFFVSQNNAQHTMTLQNGQQFAATEEWEFVANSYVFDSTPKIQIAKTATGGLIKVSVKVSSEKLYVGERIFIILKDNSLIYCTDKGRREFVEGVASTYFVLTPKEIIQLKNQEISDVRFKILGVRKLFDSQNGMFTASNALTVYDVFSPDKKTIDTKLEIKNLFK